MCGICGIVSFARDRAELERIKEMGDLIAHRGPDDRGSFFAENFALGHRRLSILDLSPAGRQPMVYEGKRGRHIVTYNGEIYNFKELRDELAAHGYTFVTETDTEVLLAAYDLWGEGCVEHFNGMWAFAIYDEAERRLFCSRDRFGKKPFYYLAQQERFLFGSEIRQLLPFLSRRVANREILLDYLLYGLEEHTDETFFEEIRKLPAGSNLVFDLERHTFSIERYYKPTVHEDFGALDEEEAGKLVAGLLEDAVRLRLVSDVKVGTCLSGGVDSSIVAALAAKFYQGEERERFVAIHGKAVEKSRDESRYAQMVAEHCGLDLKIVEPSLEEFAKHMESVVHAQEEPFGGPSVLMQYFVMQKAAQEGCKVMLDGQGGDETMFGYESYFSFYFATLLRRGKFARYFADLRRLHTFKVSKKSIVRNSIILLVRHRLLWLETLWRRRRLPLKVTNDPSRLRELFAFVPFKEFQIREITRRGLPHLLRYEDKNAMYHSVETRLPYVDYRFVEAAVSIKDGLKFKRGYLKYLLRKVGEKLLPKEVIWRKEKFGFEAPTGMLMQKYREKMIETVRSSKLLGEIVDLDRYQFSDDKILWRLYNVAVWEKVFGVEAE